MKKTEELAKEGVIFEAKPDAIPYNYRISYKISTICLLIHSCCGRRGCSLIKMHIIGSALSDNRFKQELIKFLNSRVQHNLIVRFDPALNRALEYAVADAMIAQQGNGTYKLIEKGKKLVKAIIEDKEIFRSEKETLNEISLSLTEERIKEISERWKYQNAEN